MKVGDLRTLFQKELSGTTSSEEIDSFAIWIAEDLLGYSRLELSLNKNEVIPSEVKEKIQNAIRRLKDHEPIQYIIGNTEFYGLHFKVTPDTLIPRPETEELVGWILAHELVPSNLVDIGTGSGCIAISLAKHLPECEVFAMDISEAAIAIAQFNAEANQVEVDFVCRDIFELEHLQSRFDLIVSNPPYVREKEKELMSDNVLRHEPEVALYVNNEDPLLYYRKIVSLAVNGLKGRGWLFFEINEYLSQEMKSLMEESGFENVELKQDFRGKDRFIRGQKSAHDKTR